jgi:hypothetical protein
MGGKVFIMASREEIREGIEGYLRDAVTFHKTWDFTVMSCEVLQYLHSQGVVLKVDKPLPHKLPECPNNEWSAGYCCGEEFMQDIMVEAGYVAVEPLIMDSSGDIYQKHTEQRQGLLRVLLNRDCTIALNYGCVIHRRNDDYRL